MNIVFEDDSILTTEHASCSYGMPVLVVGGQAVGPADVFPSVLNQFPKFIAARTASDQVRRWMAIPNRWSAEELLFMRKFLAV